MSDHGANIKIDTKEFLKIPYNASSFERNDVRLNLDIALTVELQKWLEKVDAFVIDELSKDPLPYFEKALTTEEIKKKFKPSCTPHEKDGFLFSPTMRCKIYVAGPRGIKCRGLGKERTTDSASLEVM